MYLLLASFEVSVRIFPADTASQGLGCLLAGLTPSSAFASRGAGVDLTLLTK